MYFSTGQTKPSEKEGEIGKYLIVYIREVPGFWFFFGGGGVLMLIQLGDTLKNITNENLIQK